MTAPTPTVDLPAHPDAIHRRWWFAAAFAVALAGILLLRPSLSWRAEAWAEVATNFYPHARYDGWWTNIVVGDAGSLAWPLRLVCLVLVKVLGFQVWFVAAVQGIASAAIAACCASTCLRGFDGFGVPVPLRALIGAAFAWGAFADYECFAAINASYFAAIPMLGWCALAWSRTLTARGALAIGLAIGFLITGKMHLLVFAPLLGTAMLWQAWHRRWIPALALGAMAPFVLCQLLSILHFQATANLPVDHAMGPRELAIDALAHATGTVVHQVVPWLASLPWFIACLLIAYLVAHTMRESRDRRIATALALLVGGLLMLSLLNVRALDYIEHGLDFRGDSMPGEPRNRHFILSNLFAHLALILTAAVWARRALPLATAILMVLAFVGQPHPDDPFVDERTSHGDWAHLLPDLDRSGLIPINPDGCWCMAGGRVLHRVELANETEITEPLGLWTADAVPTAVIMVTAPSDPHRAMTLEVSDHDGPWRRFPALSTPGRASQYFAIDGCAFAGMRVRMVDPDGHPAVLTRLTVVGRGPRTIQ